MNLADFLTYLEADTMMMKKTDFATKDLPLAVTMKKYQNEVSVIYGYPFLFSII